MRLRPKLVTDNQQRMKVEDQKWLEKNYILFS
jgi:hypothetical protein